MQEAISFIIGMLFGTIVTMAILDIIIEIKDLNKKRIWLLYENGNEENSCLMLTKNVSKGLYVGETLNGKEADGAYKLAKYFQNYYQEIEGGK